MSGPDFDWGEDNSNVVLRTGFNLEPASLPVLIGLLQRAHAQARAAGWCADG